MSTLHLTERGELVADTWAESITKVRVSRDRGHYDDPEFFITPDGYGGGYNDGPWHLDGYNENTHELSEDVQHFATHAEAVAGIPAFLEENGFTL